MQVQEMIAVCIIIHNQAAIRCNCKWPLTQSLVSFVIPTLVLFINSLSTTFYISFVISRT